SVVIGGKTFKVDGTTMLDNGLGVGVVARVEFIAQADGSMLATEIETDAADDAMAPGAVEVGEDAGFSGTIESMGDGSVVIGGKTFKVDGTTMLDNGLGVGVVVRVEFIAQADGSMLATEIETGVSGDGEVEIEHGVENEVEHGVELELEDDGHRGNSGSGSSGPG
ncbi:MAG: hypothetical protein HY683_03585, partial [Chloroflexi bacterium]|nr:hypothetical protein [Chloroflexota bacterium]